MDIAINEQGAAAERRHGRPILSTLHALWSIGGLTGAISGAVIGGLPPVTCASIILALLAGIFVVAQFHLLRDLYGRRATSSRPIPVGLALILVGLFAGCCVAADGAVRDWSALYLPNAFAGNISGASVGYAAYAGAMAVFRFFRDRLSAEFGENQLLFASNATALGSLAIISSEDSAETAVVGFLLFGVGIANVFPFWSALQARVMAVPASLLWSRWRMSQPSPRRPFLDGSPHRCRTRRSFSS